MTTAAHVRVLRDASSAPATTGRVLRVVLQEGDRVLEFRRDLGQAAATADLGRVELTTVVHEAVAAIGNHKDFRSTPSS